ncbi:MAG: hypothetical protein ACTHMS_06965 [Jatrophihabitans sp.]|uniref:hypothetical protein n=1 Tax=Jatrophihabitans sp. TaxID=1932789 RepID=UPI003F7CF3CC
MAASTADAAAHEYLTALASWRSSQLAALADGARFTSAMRLGATETPAELRRLVAACGRLKAARVAMTSLPTLRPLTTGASTYVAARQTASRAAAAAVTVSGDLDQMVSYCVFYTAGVRSSRVLDASYRSWAQRFEYSGTIVIGGRSWTCPPGERCTRDDPALYGPSRTAYRHYADLATAFATTFAAEPVPFAGTVWATFWKLNAQLFRDDAAAARAYAAALYTSRQAVAANQYDAAYRRHESETLRTISRGMFPHDAVLAFERLPHHGSGAQFAFFGRWQLQQSVTEVRHLLETMG